MDIIVVYHNSVNVDYTKLKNMFKKSKLLIEVERLEQKNIPCSKELKKIIIN